MTGVADGGRHGDGKRLEAAFVVGVWGVVLVYEDRLDDVAENETLDLSWKFVESARWCCAIVLRPGLDAENFPNALHRVLGLKDLSLKKRKGKERRFALN